MISRRAAAVVLLLLTTTVGAVEGYAVGVDLGCEIVSLDVAGTLTRVPAALSAGSDELITLLVEQGLPPAEVADIESDFDAAIAGLSEGLAVIPPLLPVPLIRSGLELPLHWVIVDGVRVSGGVLNEAIVRAAAGAAGVEIPDPLLEEELEIEGETARFAVDASFSAWALSIEAMKRLDVWIAALDLSAGISCASGALGIDVSHDLPPEWADGVDAALAELHLGDARWLSFGTHIGARLELGLPFLRLYVQARLVQPVAEWIGWWNLRTGWLSGSVGVVIRF